MSTCISDFDTNLNFCPILSTQNMERSLAASVRKLKTEPHSIKRLDCGWTVPNFSNSVVLFMSANTVNVVISSCPKNVLTHSGRSMTLRAMDLYEKSFWKESQLKLQLQEVVKTIVILLTMKKKVEKFEKSENHFTLHSN